LFGFSHKCGTDPFHTKKPNSANRPQSTNKQKTGAEEEVQIYLNSAEKVTEGVDPFSFLSRNDF